MKTLKLYKNSIPSDTVVACDTAQKIVEFFQSNMNSICQCSLFEIKVILNELMINAVKHGNKCDPEKIVNINAGICPDNYVYVMVEDEGEGYDQQETTLCDSDGIDAFNSLCDLKETGRGILIVKTLSDSVRYNRKGNKVIILKKIILD